MSLSTQSIGQDRLPFSEIGQQNGPRRAHWPPRKPGLCLGTAILLVVMALDAGTAESRSQTLNRANVGQPRTAQLSKLDPTGITSSGQALVIADLFDGLVEVTRQGEFVPGVAESWELSPDRRTWLFELRPDARWSDGALVTAQDFVLGIAHDVTPDGVDEGWLESIVGRAKGDSRELGVRALGRHSLAVHLTSENALDLAEVAVAALPLPSHVAPQGERIHWSDWPGRPSNGAYRLVQIEADGSYLLEANPHHPDTDEIGFERVRFQNLTWPEAAPAFLAGHVDVLTGVPIDQVDFLRSRGGRLVEGQELNMFYSFNTKTRKLEDVRVRRALSLVIDRPKLVARAFGDLALPSESLLPSRTRRNLDRVRNAGSSGRLEEARDLMRRAGYSNDNPLKLTIFSNHQREYEQVATLVAEQWRQIFVEVQLDMAEEVHRGWLERIVAGEFEVARVGTVFSSPSASSFFLHCLSVESPLCGYASGDDFHALVKATWSEVDLAARDQLGDRAEDVLLENHPIVPLYHRSVPVVHQPTVEVRGRSKQYLPLSSHFYPLDSFEPVREERDG